jgi:AraC-like DNA-binding protein
MSANAPHVFTLELDVKAGDDAAFEGWRMGVAPIFDMQADPPESRPYFHVHAVSHQFADATISTSQSAPQLLDRSRAAIARAGLDQVMVLTYLTGHITVTANGRDTRVEAGDVVVLDLTHTCALRLADCSHIGMMLPRAAVAEFLSDIESLHGVVLRKDKPVSSMMVAHLRAVLAEAPHFSVAEARAAVRATAALVAAYAGPSRRQRAGTQDIAASASLQAMRRAIEDHLSDAGLDAGFLLAQFGVSRAKLYRLFAPLGGVRTYIQQRRLIRAYQAIANPAGREERISTIARRHGFPSDTAFSRAFRKVYGVAPSDMRAMLERGEASPPQLADDTSHAFARVNRWLLGLDNEGR